MGKRHVFSVAPPGLWWSLRAGIMWSLGSESHGSRRGLIADAPTGAGEQYHRSVVLISEASAYTPELYQQKCDAVYQHVYDSYRGEGQRS